jgi:murein DD-endopeptidase MepM/ murein hydrolase activator NlpD
MTRLPSRGTAILACLLLLLLLLPLPASAGSAAPAPVSVAFQAAEPAYQWPLAGTPDVTRRFDPPAQRWLPGHRGVDLAGAPGAVVVAAGPGTVYFAGTVAGRGVVSVAHPDGLRTTYQPVTPVVSAGDPVAASDPIGVLDPGHAGCPVAACLHWGLRQGDDYLDPLALLGLGRIRLLPRDQA